jgi:hypothetical protein
MAFQLPKHLVGEPFYRKIFTPTLDGRAAWLGDYALRTPGLSLYQKLFTALETADPIWVQNAFFANAVPITHGGKTRRYNLAFTPATHTLSRSVESVAGRTVSNRHGVRRFRQRYLDADHRPSGAITQMVFGQYLTYANRNRDIQLTRKHRETHWVGIPQSIATPEIAAGIAPPGPYTQKDYPPQNSHPRASWHRLTRQRHFYLGGEGLEVDKTTLHDRFPARPAKVIRFHLSPTPPQ